MQSRDCPAMSIYELQSYWMNVKFLNESTFLNEHDVLNETKILE